VNGETYHWRKKMKIHTSKEEMLEALVRDLTDMLRATPSRNDTLEEVAKEFDSMKVFGDTAASFAIFVRGMKS